MLIPGHLEGIGQIQWERKSGVRISSQCLLFVVLAFGAVMNCVAQTPVQRMDQVVQSYVDAKQFMGSVLVGQGDTVLFEKSYGSANLEWNIPNAPDTKFRVGSVTKQFTATCILLLEERGKLKLSDPIKQYLPGIPETWNPITIRQLLTHTSGITELVGLPDFETTQLSPTTPEKTIALLRDKPLDFVPGAQFSYSNSGYIVAGAIIEKVSGQSYEQFLQENIFTPLGMSGSGYDLNATVIPNRASGYASGPNGLSNASYVHMTVPFAAGGLYSTSEDLFHWNQALFGYQVLSESSVHQMTTPEKFDYGMGLAMMTSRGRPVIQHGGVIEGFKAFLSYYPESRVTVVVLANSEISRPASIASLLGALAHGDKVIPPAEWKAVSVPPAVLKRHVGVYESPRPEKDQFKISLDGNRLTVEQWPGDEPKALIPRSPTVFLAAELDTEFEFVKNKAGLTDRIKMIRMHFDDTAERISVSKWSDTANPNRAP
jgi:CubicO group peptidase (beta-lactamase class C family)